MTPALLRSWSVVNCRDPTATPSVMLRPVTAEVLATLRTPGLRFSAARAAGHGHRCAFLGHQAGSLLIPATWSARKRCSSAGSSTPIQGRVPAACREAMLPRAATMPRARLHSRGPSTSPCSAPRSLGIGESSFLLDKGHVAAAAVCLATPPPRSPPSIRSSQSSCSRQL